MFLLPPVISRLTGKLAIELGTLRLELSICGYCSIAGKNLICWLTVESNRISKTSWVLSVQ